MQLRSVTCWDCRVHGGESNGHWKGGRTKHQAGYVMVLFRSHPRAGANGYVFEHVLVMEDLLGRHLVKGETVHHLNGVKDDNRPENLELWTRPQPSGIRARDALAWALEVVARYEKDFPQQGTAPEP